MRQRGNGFGIASFVCGVLALIFFLSFFNLPLVVASVALGVVHLVSNREKLWAILGMSAAFLSVILMLLGWAAIFYGASKADPEFMERFQQEIIHQYQSNQQTY